ncbi:MAG: hypothetical protein BroJett030_24510 [Alphaproteobacteria bacterium]|nr:MAG: hypothetical protein BroJett030_24510 [Alphaproteobacteria bacterium]
MKFGRISAMVLAAFAGLSASVAAPPAAQAEEVYFIRGFMNVWSRGMDQMTSQLRARGVNAKSISNGQWSGIAQDIIRRHRQGRVSHPIVIAGHSTGGQEAPQFANTLAQAGVPVALVIGVDPGFAAPPPFTAGSARVVNFWIQGSARGKPYRAAGNFNGSIQNIDIRSFSNADHVQLEKDPAVQSRIVNLVLATVNGG